ncbi:hypothetical protein BCR35DRAFT_298123 [Leucosporidium creatinivorum]|uniref:DNA primase n=1 Tax=Leucosporidium creatinivorum TaxID=106004 RepID=A0A1Y2G3X8_9BASI|nr:hypothetical protein BCR35DRAFT_298123 [Leucosporidium creatinivorum]
MPGLPPHNTAVKAEDGPALDDLFADDDKPKLPSAEATLATMSDLSNPFVMLTYYRRCFPFKQLFLWLNHGQVPTRQFTHREFAMNLPNDVYIRYNSYANAEEMKKDVVRLNPARFEIGPVYSGRPKDKKVLMKNAFKPLLRELVFDIDMTDYDSIRTCCKDKAMCKRCWRFISMAVKVLDETLRNDFGFNHLLWVYSGRRGIHCWVSDPAALALSDDQRRAIVNYIEVIKGGAKQDKKVNLPRPLHPSMLRALETLNNYFPRVVLEDQDCFKDPEQWETILALLPDRKHAEELKKEFEATPSKASAERWKSLLQIKASNELTLRKHRDFVEDIKLQYTYPRIDTEVSKKLNHLLKSPFCIHPGTGRVCVPLLASQVESFDPSAVPTVGQLLMELEELARSGGSVGNGGVDDKTGWEKTSLRPYVELFEKYVEGLVKEGVRGRKEEKAESMEF